MPPFLFATVVVVATLICLALLVRLAPAAFRITTLTLPGVLLSSFGAFVLVGAPWVYDGHPGTARDPYLALLSAGMLMTALGTVVARHLVGRVEVPRTELPASSTASWLLPVAVAGALGIFALYLVVVPEVPLLVLLRGDSASTDLDLAREQALKLLPGQVRYVFSLTRSIVLPFLAISTYLEARRRRRVRWWLLFLLTFAVGAFFAAATLEKSSVGALLITLFLGALFGRGRDLTPRRVASLGALGIGFPIFVTSSSVGFDLQRTGDVLLALGRRIFYLPSEVVFRYVDYTGEHGIFFMGRTLPYVSKYLPDGPVAIDNIIYLEYYGTGAITSGSANAGYLGELWVNFGWYGALVGAFVVGALVCVLQHLIATAPRTTATVALRAIVVYQVVGLSSTGFSGMLDPFGPGSIWLLAGVFLIIGLASRRRRRTVRVSSNLVTV